jgi:hypothetical protein
MDIDSVFKRELLSLKSFLEEIRQDCLLQEAFLKADERVMFVRSLEERHFPLIVQHFHVLNRVSAVLTDDDYLAHKAYARENLCPLVIADETVLNKQINEKPFGYAGDYVVARCFYEDGYTGSSLWGMFMDRFTVKSPLATAHRNRRKYLSGIIENLHCNQGGEKLRVASFACGPAPEVFDCISKGLSNIDYFLLDGEKDVLVYLRNRLDGFPKAATSCTLRHENVINLVRRNEDLGILKQDLIYCAGFFDYIKDSTARKTIRYMLGFLKQEGRLLIVNVSMDDVRDVCLKMLADWDLNHRSEQNLLDLAGNDHNMKVNVWADEQTKRNLYLLITKG